MITAEEYRLLGFTDADRAAAEKFEADPAAVEKLAGQLRATIGTFRAEGDGLELPEDPRISVAAFLRTVPDIRAWHRRRGITDEISWATLADLGLQLDVHRRTFGEYGLATHWWLTNHWVGLIYTLGRLQYLLHQVPAVNPAPGTEPGEWVIGVHIPESGPLTPGAIDESFDQAREFFPRVFPEYPVRTATLDSWLLDSYLLDNLPQDSNMVRFGRRFTPYGEPRDSQDSAIFFTFRSHDLSRLDEFPRDTRLQRLIVERIKAGGTWQSATGYLKL
ncbi:acyltransferase domain-containing protein [Kribbella sp. CA-293567]|uniref:acyltransferase domain-containing protein n=1 Tax=Kribbella sp. CA-293567 TaxID=3002436 RepID=UPI0022DD4972|nr:acyltransferase domain-containing protein [Kribbella sp. CA-293567]WBQ06950.1 acyltransferase domain-containing protein [Kribbella sp. CA-293567]